MRCSTAAGSRSRMGYVPSYETEESFIETERFTITVHPPSVTARPIGYAPWPKPKKAKKRKKGKR